MSKGLPDLSVQASIPTRVSVWLNHQLVAIVLRFFFGGVLPGFRQAL